MATEVTAANVLPLGEYCRQRVEEHVEVLLDEDVLEENLTRRAQVAADAIDAVLYDHLERVLELWSSPLRGGVA